MIETTWQGIRVREFFCIMTDRAGMGYVMA
jgi:hypothetical protein